MNKYFIIALAGILCSPHLLAQQDTAKNSQQDTTKNLQILPEVIVTGVNSAIDKQKFPMTVSILNQKDFLHNSATNVIDALSTIPGVNQITIGPAISKPVIRGLAYNRVVVINDGVRQEGQQWGDEFGIEIDEYSVRRAEVLKGPASLRYGSDAMAGVINLLPQTYPSEGKIEGRVLANYQTNNGLIGGNFNLGGNQKGFVWDVNYTYKTAHDYRNKYDGLVWNSNFGESNIKGSFGLQRKWGYSTITLSSFDQKLGIIEGARDSATGAFTRSALNHDGTEDSAVIVTDAEMLRYNNYNVIHQQIHHYKAVWDNSILLGKGRLGIRLGFQQNHRQEANDITLGDLYNFDFFQQTLSYDLNYSLNTKNNWTLSFGANGMDQIFRNRGIAFLYPEYHSFDVGLYSLAQKTFNKLTISGGLRFDTRWFNGDDLFLNDDGERIPGPEPNSTQQFVAYKSNFSGVSGSIGATYDFTKALYGKLNLARGFRAPNVAESGSNGIHDGTPFYEIGDPNLKPETNLQVDATFGINTPDVTAEATLFLNSINNYIFASKLESVNGGDSLREDAPTYKFVASDAVLRGGEIILNYHPKQAKWFQWNNSFSFIHGLQLHESDSSRYLPFIPPNEILSKMIFSVIKDNSVLRNSYISVGVDQVFEQNRVFYKFGNETVTPGYTLLNVGLGTDIYSKKKQIMSVYVLANNITDVAYQSNMSRLKYLDTNNLTGRVGVYNMGRNISIKLLIPLSFGK